MLRAFSTLEGIGKTLNPDYKFSEVARPYATELLDLQVCTMGGGMHVCVIRQIYGTFGWSCLICRVVLERGGGRPVRPICDIHARTVVNLAK